MYMYLNNGNMMEIMSMTPCVQLYMCKVVNNGHLYIMMDMMSICEGLSVCIIYYAKFSP